MRNLFVLKTSPLNCILFSLRGQSFPICTDRSMIDPRLRGKKRSSTYPLPMDSRESFVSIYKLYDRMVRTLSKGADYMTKFQPLNFFEYVMKCRFEHRMESCQGFAPNNSYWDNWLLERSLLNNDDRGVFLGYYWLHISSNHRLKLVE